MLTKIHSYARERERGISLTETIVAVVIIVIVLTATAYALTSAFSGSNASQNFNKAYSLINKQFAVSKQVSYDKLGIVQSEAATQYGVINSMRAITNADGTRCSIATPSNAYNRLLDVYKGACDSTLRPNTTCADPSTAANLAAYKGEPRVNLTYSNSAVSGAFANNGDPGTSQNISYPVYCAWYQFAQGSGDVLYKSDVAPCSAGNTAGATNGCATGGVGTIFTVETNVTWVSANNFDTSDGTTARNDTGGTTGFSDCSNITGTNNCFQAKRVTVTVRWVEASPNGPQSRSVTSSFIRSPTIANCLPVGGNGFVSNASPAPSPVPTATNGVSGVSCGQGS